MDIKGITGKIQTIVKKYKYAILIVVVGLLLMMLPTGNSTKKSAEKQESVPEMHTSIDESLGKILSHVSGAGTVQVLLTTQAGEETIYQENKNISITKDSESSRNDTVTVTDESRAQSGLVRQVKAPVYRGAVVICQGADSAEVRLSIIDAVSKVTGLRSDQISVLKMK